MAKQSLLIALIVFPGVLLSACDRNSGGEAPGGDVFAARPAAKEDQFGKGFGKAFRAAPNSEPANVAEVDVVPVSLTAEPVDIN